jgi:hypothetical protein
MRATVSPSTRGRYPLTMLCQVWRVGRSSVYAAAAPREAAPARSKGGPKTAVSDGAVLAAIRGVLQATPLSAHFDVPHDRRARGMLCTRAAGLTQVQQPAGHPPSTRSRR